MKPSRIAVLSIASCVAMATVACSDRIPSAPAATTAQVASASLNHRYREREADGRYRREWNQGSTGTNQAALVWCESREPASASADIGPAGGVIAVGNARLILPPGALNTTLHVTATQPGGHNAMVSFEPSGLQFNKPAGLQFDVSGCDVSGYTPDVVYLNDEGVIVERIESVYSPYWHQVAAPVKHFSSYALAW